ncbi:hypothetical protein [Marinilactibacillus psychrotolerans]|uniref:hypothetical protein n=1 Tax=Marinilactibacillus psychrotolerans TaxID=191770 RepID=UPI001D019F1E|nr:hypothetical protein [Marinilactibacillus psychrotolerans]
MFELLFRFLLLCLVFLGLYQFSLNTLKIKAEFIPLFNCSLIGIVIFIAGILNILKEAATIIIVFAVFYLLYSIISKKFQYNVSIGILYFAGLILYFAILFKGKMFIHYDDFSHWGLIAREISLTNMFPNFESDLITFQSYPTGSASFIYFIARILGSTEGVFLFAQSILIAASMTTFFAFVKKNKILNTIIIVIATVFCLIAYNSPFVLLVDTLLPLIGIAVTVIIIFYFKKNSLTEAFFIIVPISSFLIIIKNSSIFFVVINAILLAYCIFKNERSLKKSLPFGLASIGIPYTLTYLWKKHVEQVFPAALESKHSMSLNNYESVLLSKSNSDINNITDAFVQKMTTLSNTDMTIIVFLLSTITFIFIYKYFVLKKDFKSIIEWKLLVANLLIYIIYQFSLWAMYIVSMPLSEALALAAYQRYSYTIIIFLYGINILYIIIFNQEIDFKKNTLSIYKLLLVLMLALIPVVIRDKTEDIVNLATFNENELPIRNLLKKSLEGHTVPKDGKYFIYISDNELLNKSGILTYLSRYELRSTNIKIINNNALKESLFEEERYLLILQNDEKMQDLLEENGFNGFEKPLIKLEN